MPGDLEGLAGADFRAAARRGACQTAGAGVRSWAMMQRRYESYKDVMVVKTVLPRSLQPSRPADRAGRRARRVELRPGGDARSRKRADRRHARLPRRPRFDRWARLFRPRVDRISVCGDQGRSSASSPATTGWRPCAAGAPSTKAGDRARIFWRGASTWMSSPSPPCAPPGKRNGGSAAGTGYHRSWARRPSG